MTLTDFHSKWVEAFPLTQNLSQDVAKCVAEVINQQGYPLGILSRLPRRILMEVRDTAPFQTFAVSNIKNKKNIL